MDALGLIKGHSSRNKMELEPNPAAPDSYWSSLNSQLLTLSALVKNHRRLLGALVDLVSL